MVAGGGASVVYADTISDLGFGHELANYGEYSGAPTTEHTYEYAKTLISLMTREKDPRGKIFIIGGGIANFTDVAATFTGLIKAIVSFQDDLRSHNVRSSGHFITCGVHMCLCIVPSPLALHVNIGDTLGSSCRTKLSRGIATDA